MSMNKLEAFATLVTGYETQLCLTEHAKVTNTKTDRRVTRFVGGFFKNGTGTVLVEVNVYSEGWINFKAFDSTNCRVRTAKEESIETARKTLSNWLA